MTTDAPRSLFVTSADPDELALAMSFLRGQAFAEGARMLLPGSLYAINKDTLPLPVDRYSSLADITSALDKHRPSLVFFFSAYRSALDRTLPVESLGALLGSLRERRCRVITSDPFLGLAPTVTRTAVDARLLALDRHVLVRAAVRLLTRLQGSKTSLVQVPALDDVTHLYFGAIPNGESRVRRLSFFNPTLNYEALATPEAVARNAPRATDTSSGPWLFVVTADDLNAQVALVGIEEFRECLLGLLRSAVEAEAKPILAAPASIVTPFARALGDSVQWLPDSPFIELEKHVLEAGYVFDWNVFSCSHLTRLARGLPVFAFDKGLLARTIGPFYEPARAFYFGEWKPATLDQRRLSSPYVLSHLAQAQQPAARILVERWRASPPPDAVVGQLLDQTISPSR